ncbi:hypothetical protein [Novosphingobium colocasiae]|uniref:hypothetical protein n=1 Tax=Novosphingobium colocasiae TaxID=1256513 RepID=UPI0035AE853F
MTPILEFLAIFAGGFSVLVGLAFLYIRIFCPDRWNKGLADAREARLRTKAKYDRRIAEVRAEHAVVRANAKKEYEARVKAYLSPKVPARETSRKRKWRRWKARQASYYGRRR